MQLQLEDQLLGQVDYRDVLDNYVGISAGIRDICTQLPKASFTQTRQLGLCQNRDRSGGGSEEEYYFIFHRLINRPAELLPFT